MILSICRKDVQHKGHMETANGIYWLLFNRLVTRLMLLTVRRARASRDTFQDTAGSTTWSRLVLVVVPQES